jgi:hypothetical protein
MCFDLLLVSCLRLFYVRSALFFACFMPVFALPGEVQRQKCVFGFG